MLTWLVSSSHPPAINRDRYPACMHDRDERVLVDQAYVLHENMAFTKVYSDFNADYATGKSIFLRSVGQLSGGPGNLLAKVIVLSASAVWNNRNQVSVTPDPHRDPDQFTFNWNGNLQPQYEPLWLNTSKGPALDNLIMQTAGQDALNTVLALNLGTELA